MEKEDFTSIGICFSCGVRKRNGKDVLAWDTRARTDRAFILYKLGYISKILCTGGIFQKGQQVPIAELMKGYLTGKGVPKNDILIETRSVETVENIKFSLLLLKKRNILKNLKNAEQLRLVLISEPNHLRRIEIIARAYLERHKIGKFVPLLLDPVHYHISEKTRHEEDAMLYHTALDPLGEGEIFEKIRQERRQALGKRHGSR
ncbi:YdcF family protein [Candidatus Uhrbacteria bacterium]|nr:YdcF family protein [Candidatus Uhrbacteria bacterium]